MTGELAGFIALVLFYMGSYAIQWRRTSSARQDAVARAERQDGEVAGLKAEIARLRSSLDSKDIIIADLKRDLGRLTHIETLYNTLVEGHRLLQENHSQLRMEFDDLRRETDALRTELECERATRTDVEAHNGELKELLRVEKVRTHDLETMNDVLRETLAQAAALGTERAEAQAQAAAKVAGAEAEAHATAADDGPAKTTTRRRRATAGAQTEKTKQEQ